jgi:hypothetical protein
MYARKSLVVRVAPFSVTIDSGYPWTENVSLRLLIILAVVIQFRILTSTHVE